MCFVHGGGDDGGPVVFAGGLAWKKCGASFALNAPCERQEVEKWIKSSYTQRLYGAE